MIIGPVFTRELVTAPRRLRFFLLPFVYVAGLLLLLSTAWALLTGTQDVRTVGDMARFGTTIFQILAVLQVTLALLFSALLSASAVAQEKDRRTLILLLLTNLSNSELVLGKLLSSVLGVALTALSATPFFLLVALLGGVAYEQVALVTAVTLATIMAAGSLGSTVALWRETTFLALATTALLLFVWVGGWTFVANGGVGASWGGIGTKELAASFAPIQATMNAVRPRLGGTGTAPWWQTPPIAYLVTSLGVAAVLNGIAIWRVRVWNPSREARPRFEEAEESQATAVEKTTGAEGIPAGGGMAIRPSVHAIRRRQRVVWDNPVLWREVCTWAYGRRVLLLRIAYWLLFAAAAFFVHSAASGLVGGPAGVRSAGLRSELSLVLAPLFVLSLILINALAVNSIANERDLGALDLLLVTDLNPAEFIFGKLGGIFYVTKEMVLLPLLLCGYLWWVRAVSFENFLYLAGGLVVMDCFVAMLGVHVGLAYSNSRTAVAVSLGTVLFLFLGVATSMRIMVAFSGSFETQLPAFLAAIVGGSLGLYAALGVRNPSGAIALAAFTCPAATFVAITSFLNRDTLGVFGIAALAYGFATAAMLIPAIHEFDVATGRTTSGGD